MGIRGEKGLQTLERIALALALLALVAALAIGSEQTEARLGQAISTAATAWFRCFIGRGAFPLTAVWLQKAGPCPTQPTACLARWGDCVLRSAREGTDPGSLPGLLPSLVLGGSV